MARTDQKTVSPQNLSARQKRFFTAGILLPLALYYALTISHFDYVPLWDSMENLEEYLFLPRQHLAFDNLLLMHNGHPALGYFWPFWIGQWLFPSELLAVHVINVLIGSLAIIAFAKVAGIAFRETAGESQIMLLTAAFAVQPVFVAYAVNMSPDYGVLAYFLATLWLLLAGQPGWAALTGVLLLFSKEIGIAAYVLLVVFYFSGAFRNDRGKRAWPLAVPLLAFASYCVYQRGKDEPVFPWVARWLKDESVWQRAFPDPFKWDFKLAALGPFFLEFQWIFAAIVLIGVVAGLATHLPRRVKLAEMKEMFRGLQLPLRSFLFLLLGCLYLVSRVVQWTNQRYFLILYPLLLLAFFAALLQLNLSEKTRKILLVCSIVLFLACNFRTLDPFSRAVAGTFPFGRHALLGIATIRPDFGACNRDEMVYNLEHTHFSRLLDLAFAKIRPTEQTTIVMASDAWWVVSRLDPKTFRRTESTRKPFIQIRPSGPEGIVQNPGKPDMLFVLALPNLDNGKVMRLLAPFYDVSKRHVVADDGYELEVFELTRKPAAPHRPSTLNSQPSTSVWRLATN